MKLVIEMSRKEIDLRCAYKAVEKIEKEIEHKKRAIKYIETAALLVGCINKPYKFFQQFSQKQLDSYINRLKEIGKV